MQKNLALVIPNAAKRNEESLKPSIRKAVAMQKSQGSLGVPRDDNLKVATNDMFVIAASKSSYGLSGTLLDRG